MQDLHVMQCEYVVQSCHTVLLREQGYRVFLCLAEMQVFRPNNTFGGRLVGSVDGLPVGPQG